MWRLLSFSALIYFCLGATSTIFLVADESPNWISLDVTALNNAFDTLTVWNITLPEHPCRCGRIRYYFTAINLASNGSNCLDNVELTSGSGTSSSPLGVFCGGPSEYFRHNTNTRYRVGEQQDTAAGMGQPLIVTGSVRANFIGSFTLNFFLQYPYPSISPGYVQHIYEKTFAAFSYSYLFTPADWTWDTMTITVVRSDGLMFPENITWSISGYLVILSGMSTVPVDFMVNLTATNSYNFSYTLPVQISIIDSVKPQTATLICSATLMNGGGKLDCEITTSEPCFRSWITPHVNGTNAGIESPNAPVWGSVFPFIAHLQMAGGVSVIYLATFPEVNWTVTALAVEDFTSGFKCDVGLTEIGVPVTCTIATKIRSQTAYVQKPFKTLNDVSFIRINDFNLTELDSVTVVPPPDGMGTTWTFKITFLESGLYKLVLNPYLADAAPWPEVAIFVVFFPEINNIGLDCSWAFASKVVVGSTYSCYILPDKTLPNVPIKDPTEIFNGNVTKSSFFSIVNDSAIGLSSISPNVATQFTFTITIKQEGPFTLTLQYNNVTADSVTVTAVAPPDNTSILDCRSPNQDFQNNKIIELSDVVDCTIWSKKNGAPYRVVRTAWDVTLIPTNPAYPILPSPLTEDGFIYYQNETDLDYESDMWNATFVLNRNGAGYSQYFYVAVGHGVQDEMVVVSDLDQTTLLECPAIVRAFENFTCTVHYRETNYLVYNIQPQTILSMNAISPFLYDGVELPAKLPKDYVKPANSTSFTLQATPSYGIWTIGVNASSPSFITLLPLVSTTQISIVRTPVRTGMSCGGGDSKSLELEVPAGQRITCYSTAYDELDKHTFVDPRDFQFRVLEGPGRVESKLSTQPGLAIIGSETVAFYFQCDLPYSRTVITDGYTEATIWTLPSGALWSWTSPDWTVAGSSPYPTISDSPLLARVQNTDPFSFFAPGAMAMPDGLGHDQYLSMSCNNRFCLASTLTGDVIMWGSDVPGASVVISGVVSVNDADLDAVFVRKVAVLETDCPIYKPSSLLCPDSDVLPSYIALAIDEDGLIYGLVETTNDWTVWYENRWSYGVNDIETGGGYFLVATREQGDIPSIYSFGSTRAIGYTGSAVQDVTSPSRIPVDGEPGDGVTVMLAGEGYGVVVIGGDGENEQKFYSWGRLGPVFPSTPTPTQALGFKELFDNQKIIAASGNLYDLCFIVESGDVYQYHIGYNMWKLEELRGKGIERVSLGQFVYLAADRNGFLYQWRNFTTGTVDPVGLSITLETVIPPNTDSRFASAIPGMEPSVLNIPRSKITMIYSHTHQYVGFAPTSVRLTPRKNGDPPSCIDDVCNDLSSTVERYALDGTIFILEPGVHKVTSTLRQSRPFCQFYSSGVESRWFKGDQEPSENATVIDCANGACFEIKGDGLRVEGIDFHNGNSLNGGCIYVDQSTSLTIVNSVFNNCRAISGGAIFSEGNLDIDAISFSDNRATKGGAIASTGGMLDIRKSAFTNNKAQTGGALWLENLHTTLSAVEFGKNNATKEGGAIFIDSGTLTIDGGSAANNEASIGGAYYFRSANVTVTSHTIFNNSAKIQGGGIYQEFSYLTLNATELDQNVARGGDGGGLYCLGDRSLIITDSIFKSCSARQGGGAFVIFCNPMINNSMFYLNAAPDGSGGAIQFSTMSSGSTDELSDFSENSALHGGAFYIETSQPVTALGTFSSNKATKGGVFYVSASATLPAANVFVGGNFLYNEATAAGGVWYWEGSPFSPINETFDSFYLGNRASRQGDKFASWPMDIGFTDNLTEFQGTSGVELPEPINVTIFDAYRQPVSDEISVQLKVSGPRVDIIGTTETFTSGEGLVGVASFRTGFLAEPNTLVFFTATSNGLQSAPAAIQMLPCYPGEYIDVSGRMCADCTPGKYSDIEQAEDCTPCSNNTYVNRTRATTCLFCPAGFQAVGGRECAACEPGKYSAHEGDSCEVCPPGTSTNTNVSVYVTGSAGATTCYDCEPGKFSLSSASECTRCSPRSVAATFGRSSCEVCPPNSDTNDSRITCECLSGFFRVDGICEPCAEGANCTTGTTQEQIVALAGYYPDISGSARAFYPCLNDACIGGAMGTNCAVGYTGHLCASCADGYGRTGQFDCAKCPASPALNRFKLAGILLLFILVCGAFVAHHMYSLRHFRSEEAAEEERQYAKSPSTVSRGSSERNERSQTMHSNIVHVNSEVHAIAAKILISGVQFNALAVNFDYQWPTAMKNFLESQEKGVNVGASLFSFDCLLHESGQSPFYVKSLVFLFIPFFIAITPLFVYVPWGLKLRSEGRPGWFKSIRDKYITTVVIVLFLFHPSIMKQTFLLFACKRIGTGKYDIYLLEDLSQKCWTSEHWGWVAGVGFPMLFFYVIGIPLVAFWLMQKNRNTLYVNSKGDTVNGLSRASVILKYSFLYRGYCDEYYYWELMIVLRKMFICVVAVFGLGNVQVQALLAVLIIVLALLGHVYARPFQNAYMDYMEYFSLLNSFITYFGGQFFFVDSLDYGATVFLSFFIIASNILFICASLYLIFWTVTKPQAIQARMKGRVELQMMKPTKPAENLPISELPRNLHDEDPEMQILTSPQNQQQQQHTPTPTSPLSSPSALLSSDLLAAGTTSDSGTTTDAPTASRGDDEEKKGGRGEDGRGEDESGGGGEIPALVSEQSKDDFWVS